MIEQTFKQIPRNILLKNWIEYTVWRKKLKDKLCEVRWSDP